MMARISFVETESPIQEKIVKIAHKIFQFVIKTKMVALMSVILVLHLHESITAVLSFQQSVKEMIARWSNLFAINAHATLQIIAIPYKKMIKSEQDCEIRNSMFTITTRLLPH